MDNCNSEFIEISERFRAFYTENLKKNFEDLEPIRLKYLKNFGFRFIIFLILFFCMIYLPPENDFGCIIGGILIIAVWVAFYCCSETLRQYKKDAKPMVIEKILSFWGDFQYFKNNETQISHDILNASNLFDTFSDINCDDTFSGRYHGTDITVSELELIRSQSIGGRKDNFRVFKGVLIYFNMPKKFKSLTVARSVLGTSNSDNSSAQYLNKWFDLSSLFIKNEDLVCSKWFAFIRYGLWWGMFLCIICFSFMINDWTPAFIMAIIWFLLHILDILENNNTLEKNNSSLMQRVYLEDSEFHKKWKVFGSDQIEARCVLTPALMERMLEIKRKFHGNKIEFSFFDNKVLIAVHTSKDMFETTSLFTPALCYHKVQEVIGQLYTVFSIIKILRR